MSKTIFLSKDQITLGQFLKKINVIDTGGQAKFFIETNNIKINNKKPIGRSTKIKPDDIIWINDSIYVVKKQEEEK
ncbi:RNA-binding S4 domain-containing protein [Mycoplasmopsis gallinarum]|uniref:Uncharacterized protein n=1 Tax=Mycoplasmopsis gallinarum TaxID=29557 RepID=A0A168RAE9_9BACT|nr:RNA-binding S4 domain-containing protein [Mycoplasmopsis gallinarum]OAB48778.1 hypothetical protein MGALLINA_04950 [Mycoplasmopsis gallinarum]